jgi:hypothetical protein
VALDLQTLSREYLGHTPLRQSVLRPKRGETQKVVGWVHKEGEVFQIQIGRGHRVWDLPNSQGLLKKLNALFPDVEAPGTRTEFALVLTAKWTEFADKVSGKDVKAHTWQVRHAKRADLPRDPPRER